MTSLVERLRGHAVGFPAGSRGRECAMEAADEIEKLRKIISDSAAALPNGAFIHPEASVGFMEGLPKEIELVCSNLQNEIDRLRRELEEARRALRQMRCPRPCNHQPEDLDAGDCIDAGECGCIDSQYLAALRAGEDSR